MNFEEDRNALEALNLYLEKIPNLKAQQIVVYRAVNHAFLDRFSAEKLVCIQSFKPLSSRLSCFVSPYVAETQDADIAIVIATKNKRETFYHFACAYQNLKIGGQLICACENDLGAASLQKHLNAFATELGVYSKRKSRVLSFVKTGNEAAGILTEWREKGDAKPILNTRYWGQPGIYGWNKIDAGSTLLIESLQDEKICLKGRGADFGAGYGYLSSEILKQQNHIENIDLYEAEQKALDMAAKNLSHNNTHIKLYWADITQLDAKKYDWIIMNPPFHSGKKSDFALGQAFIEKAAVCLNKNGMLYMVANRQLPYEKILDVCFSKVEQIVETNVYKVIYATK